MSSEFIYLATDRSAARSDYQNRPRDAVTERRARGANKGDHGTIDEEGPVVLHRGEAVVGMTGGRLREGVMTQDGVRVTRHEANPSGWATVVGHDLVPVSEWTALRPKSAIGTVGVAVVAREGESY